MRTAATILAYRNVDADAPTRQESLRHGPGKGRTGRRAAWTARQVQEWFAPPRDTRLHNDQGLDTSWEFAYRIFTPATGPLTANEALKRLWLGRLGPPDPIPERGLPGSPTPVEDGHVTDSLTETEARTARDALPRKVVASL